jgi:hypothetical protein
VLDAASAALFHLGVASGAVRRSGSLAALIGENALAPPSTLEAFLERVHPEALRGAARASAPV